MLKTEKELNSLESNLLKELFYKNFEKASQLIAQEDILLKFNKTAEWLLKNIDALPLGASVKQKLFDKGMTSVSDIVSLKPLRCEDYTLRENLDDIKDGEYCAVRGSVYSKSRTKKVVFVTIKTKNGEFLFCNWFRLTPFLRKHLSLLKKDTEVVCEGRMKILGLRHSMNHPRIKPASEFKENMEIVYPSIFSMRNSTAIKVVKSAFSQQPEKPYDYLPYTLISKNKLMFLSEFFRYLHECKKEKEVQYRLKYEEMFLLILGLRLQEVSLKKKKSHKITCDEVLLKKKQQNLDFILTIDQKKAINEILNDMESDQPMLRLLQGDVGCGKTVVALFASFMAMVGGYQVAFMAPTQPLASQLFSESKKFFKDNDFRISLLVSSTKEKRKLYEEIKNGGINLVIGTHALLEEGVKFKKLGLIVIDEQHRFGVEQRKSLMDKGVFPHVLIMSATPIPRSIAMVLYSKSSLSTIKEKPKQRANIQSLHFCQKHREKAYSIAIEEMRKKHQVYIVAPLIENSEDLQDVRDVLALYDELSKGWLSGFKMGLLHGHMNAKEKKTVIEQFQNGYLDCIVSTTVIEVGINSPNATVMIVENAERFGLSQLHQLRGRVGRSSLESYAIFLTKDKLSDVAQKRIATLLRTKDGFEIAELDYKLRGSGEIMGVRQHGRDLIYVNIIEDKKLIETVKEDVDKLIKIHYPLNSGLLRMIEYKWQRNINYVYVG